MRSSNVVYASCKSLFISIAGIKGRQERYCLSGGHKLALFEQTVLPHMDAAGNFSSLLMRNEHGAEGMVQEVDFRFKVFNAFHGWMVTPDCSPLPGFSKTAHTSSTAETRGIAAHLSVRSSNIVYACVNERINVLTLAGGAFSIIHHNSSSFSKFASERSDWHQGCSSGV